MTTSNKKLEKNRLFVFLFVTLFIGSACTLLSPVRPSATASTVTPVVLSLTSLPTSTPVAIPTQAPLIFPTSTLLPNATLVPLQPSATQPEQQLSGTAKVLFDDDFSSQDASIKNGWTFGTSDNFDQQWQLGMQVFNLKSANNIFWDYLPQTYQDVALTIDLQPTTPGYVEYGIIFGIVPGTTKINTCFRWITRASITSKK